VFRGAFLAVLASIWPSLANAERVAISCGSASLYHNFVVDFSRSEITHGEENQIDSANGEIRTYNHVQFRRSSGFIIWSLRMPHGATFEFALDTQNWELRDREPAFHRWEEVEPASCRASRVRPE